MSLFGSERQRAEEIYLRLVELRALRERIDRHELEADDWLLLEAVVSEELAQAEGTGEDGSGAVCADGSTSECGSRDRSAT